MNCRCPEVPEVTAADVINPIPSEPIKCSCCGKPLLLTCGGECSKAHQHKFLQAAQRRAEQPGVRGGSLPGVPKVRKVRALPVPKPPIICSRCKKEIPRRLGRGRQPKFHENCLTQAERQARDSTRAARGGIRREALAVEKIA